MVKTLEKKRGALPVYTQLTNIIKEDISAGKLTPGIRIPSEAALAKEYGVSPMTVRKALGVLEEEGLVDRIHGRGTFVKRIEVGTTTFELHGFDSVLSDTEALEVNILKTTIVRTSGIAGEILELKGDAPVILVERLISHNKEPFCFQIGYLPFDPKSPVVENMLDTTGLSDLFFSNESHGYKRGKMNLLPALMEDREAKLLGVGDNRIAFKLEYVYYDFKDSPSAYGWFIIPPEQMPLVSRVGVWNE